MRPGARRRNIIENALFREEASAIQPDARRFDEIMAGVTWALSNVAESVGRPTVMERIRAVPTQSWPDAPPLVIYYTYDESTVTLLSIRRALDLDDEGF